MGNEQSKAEKNRKKNIKTEWKRNRDNRIFIFLGDVDSGKTTIIANIVSRFSKIKRTNAHKFEYRLQSFTVSETSLIGNTNDETLSSQDKAAIYDNMKVKKQKELKYEIDSSHSPIIKSLPLLIFGYIHQNKINALYDIQIPDDIISLISKYMSKSIVYSHKIINSKTDKMDICELWELSFYDRLNWSQLYQYQHLIIFVVDISVFNEFYNDHEHGNVNKLKYALDLFESVLKQNDQLNGRNIVLCFNKMDIFQKKIVDQSILLSECELFCDYTYNASEYKINDRRFDLAFKEVRKKFDVLAKQYMDDQQLIAYQTVLALDNKSVQKAFDTCLMIEPMDKEKLRPAYI